ncbi:hypothetical protein Bpfe_014190, partial [Biomphalaria pfeifferi]
MWVTRTATARRIDTLVIVTVRSADMTYLKSSSVTVSLLVQQIGPTCAMEMDINSQHVQ